MQETSDGDDLARGTFLGRWKDGVSSQSRGRRVVRRTADCPFGPGWSIRWTSITVQNRWQRTDQPVRIIEVSSEYKRWAMHRDQGSFGVLVALLGIVRSWCMVGRLPLVRCIEFETRTVALGRLGGHSERIFEVTSDGSEGGRVRRLISRVSPRQAASKHTMGHEEHRQHRVSLFNAHTLVGATKCHECLGFRFRAPE